MPYRNGTYVAFHANGTSEPTESDMKYYNLLRAWHVRDEHDFCFVNSHDKTDAVRDSSKRATLAARLRERLSKSKNMILIIGRTTKEDTDWIPFEIAHAVDTYKIPIVAAYVGYQYILQPAALSVLWPAALYSRVLNGSAHVLHIPFKQAPLADAVNQFNFTKYPVGGGLAYYSQETYRQWGLFPEQSYVSWF